MTSARSSYEVAARTRPARRRAAALTAVCLAVMAVSLGPGPAVVAASDGDAARRARFEAAWAAQDLGDSLTRVTSMLPGI
ncbi:MAG: hypothetical protein GEV08_22710 [Acidimicrobiia bacterium]|nr:hypothetical protein [Acidimicrobiia bacterium]